MPLPAAPHVTVKDLRRANRSAVLRRLFLHGPLNRVALAQLTGLSSGSITNVTAGLIEEGLVCEVGTEESNGGRPRVLLHLDPGFGNVIGVEVGEACLRVEAFDLAMDVLGTLEVPLPAGPHEPEAVVGPLVGAVGALREQLGPGRRWLGVGIAVPGTVTAGPGGSRAHAPVIGWQDVPLEGMVASRTGLTVRVGSLARALGQAEVWLGAGQGARDVAVALWGASVGAAVFSEGGLCWPPAPSAGEWGHTVLVAGGRPCRCGGAGCVEAYLGAGALLEDWRRADPAAAAETASGTEQWADRLLAAAGSDGAAARVLEQAATYLGYAVANLVHLFNPERVVLGGWLGLRLGPALLGPARATMAAQALGHPGARASLELGHLGPEAVALGASALVVDELLSDGGPPPVSAGPAGRRPGTFSSGGR